MRGNGGATLNSTRMLPKVGIIYLSYHSEPYFERAWKALQTLDYPREQLEIIIVDNPHPEFGSSEKFIREQTQNSEIPAIILPQEKNIGFAGGNNVGIKLALERGCDYVYLHNQDGFVEPGTVRKLVEAMEQDKTIGAAQSLIVLFPETDLINTSGNAYHYLGFGYSSHLREKKSQVKLKPTEEIGYASGASLILRADLLKQHGALDEDLFLYHEDLEYSLRLKSLGYRTVTVSDSIFYHEYSFTHNKNKYYFLERNRYAVMLLYYRWPTLILLLPIAVIMEIGLCLFALKRGWINEKLRAYIYWLKGGNASLWLKKRQVRQNKRLISDRTMLKQAVGTVIFDDSEIQSPLLKYLGNPLMSAYWFLVKKIIFW
jgi:GT2 family glycosyltransferase